MNAATENIIGKFLEPVFQALPDSASREIVGLVASDSLQTRVEFLAQRANEGDLTVAEQNEYRSLIDAGDILAALQAIARKSLRDVSQ